MIPSLPGARRSALLAAIVLLAALAGCTDRAAIDFDPLGPCARDGRRSGAYPELEAAIPKTFSGAPAARLDSGRNCEPASLGTLAGYGIDEVRFAGGLWETGDRSGVTIALFRAPGLTTDRLAEFYEVGARSARKTEAVSTSDFSAGSVAGQRLDTLNDESFQTIVVLDGPAPDVVRAVLVASDVREVGTREAHDAVVEGAAAAAVAP